MKHNRNVAVLVALLCTVVVWAVPAKRCKTLVRQPDGSMITVMVRGDENFHFMSTEDGMPIAMNADKAYCYAYMADDGVLRASAQVAHDAERRSLREKAFLAGHKTEVERIAGFASKLAAQRNKARLQRFAKRQNVMAAAEPALTRMAGATGGDGIGVTGKRKGLVILVKRGVLNVLHHIVILAKLDIFILLQQKAVKLAQIGIINACYVILVAVVHVKVAIH